MAQRNLSDHISGFERIGPCIYSRRAKFISPPSATSSKFTSQSQSPSLIIIFSWTGAPLNHVSKYTSHYITLYPRTHILLITSSLPDLIYRSSRKKQDFVLPAIDAITSYTSDILVHCFSEGGSHKAVQFAKAYLKRTLRKLPISTLILASTPGHPRYLRLAGAFKRSLPPNPIVQLVGTLGAYVVLAPLFARYVTCQPERNNIVQTRQGLDDEGLWDIRAPRCYLYSRADSLIDWKDVEEHGSGAGRRGTSVLMVMFEDTGHCSHARAYEQRYWDAVRWTWERSVRDRDRDREGGR